MSYIDHLNAAGPAGTNQATFIEIIQWTFVAVAGFSIVLIVGSCAALAGRCFRDHLSCCTVYEMAETSMTESVKADAVRRRSRRRGSVTKSLTDIPAYTTLSSRLGRHPVVLILGIFAWITLSAGLVIEYFYWAYDITGSVQFKDHYDLVKRQSLSIIAYVKFGGYCGWAIASVLDLLILLIVFVRHCIVMSTFRRYKGNPSQELSAQLRLRAIHRSTSVAAYYVWILRAVFIVITYVCFGMHVSIDRADRWFMWAVMVGVWATTFCQIMYGAMVWMHHRKVLDAAHASIIANLPPVDDAPRADKDVNSQQFAAVADRVSLTVAADDGAPDGGGAANVSNPLVTARNPRNPEVTRGSVATASSVTAGLSAASVSAAVHAPPATNAAASTSAVSHTRARTLQLPAVPTEPLQPPQQQQPLPSAPPSVSPATPLSAQSMQARGFPPGMAPWSPGFPGGPQAAGRWVPGMPGYPPAMMYAQFPYGMPAGMYAAMPPMAQSQPQQAQQQQQPKAKKPRNRRPSQLADAAVHHRHLSSSGDVGGFDLSSVEASPPSVASPLQAAGANPTAMSPVAATSAATSSISIGAAATVLRAVNRMQRAGDSSNASTRSGSRRASAPEISTPSRLDVNAEPERPALPGRPSIALGDRLRVYFAQVDPEGAQQVPQLLESCDNGNDVIATVNVLARLEETYRVPVPSFVIVQPDGSAISPSAAMIRSTPQGETPNPTAGSAHRVSSMRRMHPVDALDITNPENNAANLSNLSSPAASVTHNDQSNEPSVTRRPMLASSASARSIPLVSSFRNAPSTSGSGVLLSGVHITHFSPSVFDDEDPAPSTHRMPESARLDDVHIVQNPSSNLEVDEVVEEADEDEELSAEERHYTNDESESDTPRNDEDVTAMTRIPDEDVAAITRFASSASLMRSASPQQVLDMDVAPTTSLEERQPEGEQHQIEEERQQEEQQVVATVSESEVFIRGVNATVDASPPLEMATPSAVNALASIVDADQSNSVSPQNVQDNAAVAIADVNADNATDMERASPASGDSDGPSSFVTPSDVLVQSPTHAANAFLIPDDASLAEVVAAVNDVDGSLNTVTTAEAATDTSAQPQPQESSPFEATVGIDEMVLIAAQNHAVTGGAEDKQDCNVVDNISAVEEQAAPVSSQTPIDLLLQQETTSADGDASTSADGDASTSADGGALVSEFAVDETQENKLTTTIQEIPAPREECIDVETPISSSSSHQQQDAVVPAVVVPAIVLPLSGGVTADLSATSPLHSARSNASAASSTLSAGDCYLVDISFPLSDVMFASPGSTVEIAMDCSNWVPMPMTYNRQTHVFQASLLIPKDKYVRNEVSGVKEYRAEFRFVVDGIWMVVSSFEVAINAEGIETNVAVFSQL